MIRTKPNKSTLSDSHTSSPTTITRNPTTLDLASLNQSTCQADISNDKETGDDESPFFLECIEDIEAEFNLTIERQSPPRSTAPSIESINNIPKPYTQKFFIPDQSNRVDALAITMQMAFKKQNQSIANDRRICTVKM